MPAGEWARNSPVPRSRSPTSDAAPTAVEMVSQPQESRSGSVEVRCVVCGRSWRQTFRKIAKAGCWTCHPPLKRVADWAADREQAAEGFAAAISVKVAE